jgi:transcriptional regulator with XRE-family HTH domain
VRLLPDLPSRIQNGNANPSLNAMEVIANALGLTVFELFDKVKNTVSGMNGGTES